MKGTDFAPFLTRQGQVRAGAGEPDEAVHGEEAAVGETSYELPGSGLDNAFLDANAATGLINHSYGSPQLGRYVNQIRNGLPALTSGAPVNATSIGAGGVSVYNPTCSTAHPVNCASGDFWHSTTDFSIPERGGPLSVTRTYNSLLASSSGAFGHGWSWSLGGRLAVSSDGTVTITTGDGSAVTAHRPAVTPTFCPRGPTRPCRPTRTAPGGSSGTSGRSRPSTTRGAWSPSPT